MINCFNQNTKMLIKDIKDICVMLKIKYNRKKKVLLFKIKFFVINN